MRFAHVPCHLAEYIGLYMLFVPYVYSAAVDSAFRLIVTITLAKFQGARTLRKHEWK